MRSVRLFQERFGSKVVRISYTMEWRSSSFMCLLSCYWRSASHISTNDERFLGEFPRVDLIDCFNQGCKPKMKNASLK